MFLLHKLPLFAILLVFYHSTVSLPSGFWRVDARRSHYSDQELAFRARIGYPLNKGKRSPRPPTLAGES